MTANGEKRLSTGGPHGHAADAPDTPGKTSARVHPVLLVGVLAGWLGSMLLYTYVASGPMNYSALLIISLVWILAFFLIGTATIPKRQKK